MDSYYDDGGCCIVHPDSTDLILTGGKGPITQTNWSFVVSRSRDGGRTWTRSNLSGASSGWCHALAVAPSQPNVIYAGGDVAGPGAVYRSTDFGTTWTGTATAPTATVYSLEVDPSDAAMVYAATPDGAFLTTDSGETWINLYPEDLRAVRLYPGSPDTLLVGGSAGVAFSTDGGDNWNQLNSGLDGRAVNALAFADHDGDYLVAGTVGGSCYAWQFGAGIADKPVTMNDRREAMNDLHASPNPFAEATSVNYELGLAGPVDLTVRDVSGRLVRRLESGYRTPGKYEVRWNATDDRGRRMPAGIYFLRFSADGQSSSRRVTLVR